MGVITRLLSLIGIKGKDGLTIATPANPIPVEIENNLTIPDPIGIEGKDAATQATAANPLPVEVQGTVPVSGPLTDAQLRASAVPVSDGHPDPQLNSLTQSQLEVELDEKFGDLGAKTGVGSAPVVTATDDANLSSLKVVGPGAGATAQRVALSDEALSALAAITGYNLEATQLSVKAKTDNLDVALSTRLKPADTLAAVTSITNVVHVDDNAGSLTVDGTVAAAQSGTWIVQQGAPPWSVTGNIASGSIDSGNPVKIGGKYSATPPIFADGQRGDAQLDVNGNLKVAGSFSSIVASDHLEDSAHASGDSGSFALAVRNDADATLTSTNLDYSPIAVNPAGILKTLLYAFDGTNGVPVLTDFNGGLVVSPSDRIGSGFLPKAEDSVASGGESGIMALAVRNDANVVKTSADGDFSAISVDSAGRVKISPATVATLASEHAEDAGHTSGDTGSFALAVRSDAGATMTSNDGDYSPIAVDSFGSVRVVNQVGGSLNVFSTRLIPGTTATDLGKAEDAPHVSGHTGVMSLGVRNDSGATLTSADGDYSPFAVDSAGRLGISDLGGSVTIDGTVSVSGTVAVSGPLTDAQLRATPVPVSGPLTDAQLRATSVPVVDDLETFESNHSTLVASTDTTITFASANVKMVRVTNWDITNRILVKDGSISSDTDSSASRVGVAPVSNVSNDLWFPIKTGTIHLRSAGASEVTVEGFIQ